MDDSYVSHKNYCLMSNCLPQSSKSMPRILAGCKLRQEDHQFKVNLGFVDPVLKNEKGWLYSSEEHLPVL